MPVDDSWLCYKLRAIAREYVRRYFVRGDPIVKKYASHVSACEVRGKVCAREYGEPFAITTTLWFPFAVLSSAP